MRIRRNFISREGSKTANNFRGTEVRAKNSNRKEPSGYKSGIRDRKEWTWKREKGQEGWMAMDDKEDRGASLSPY